MSTLLWRRRCRTERIDGLPAADYHAMPYPSASRLKKGVADGTWAKLETEFAPSPALIVGSGIHAVALQKQPECDLYEHAFVVAPDVDRRTKAGREAWREFEAASNGRTVVTESQDLVIQSASDALRSNRAICDIVDNCDHEVSFIWYDETHRLPNKARLDLLSDDCKLIGDIKSARDASPEGFGRSCANLHYCLQPAMYFEAVEAVTGVRPEAFVYCVVETEEPYLTGVYYVEYHDPYVEAGRQLLKRARKSLRKYLDTAPSQRAGSYTETAQRLEVPAWYTNRILQEATTYDFAS